MVGCLRHNQLLLGVVPFLSKLPMMQCFHKGYRMIVKFFMFMLLNEFPCGDFTNI